MGAAAQNRNCLIAIFGMALSEFEIKKVKNAAVVFLTVKRAPPHIACLIVLQSIQLQG